MKAFRVILMAAVLALTTAAVASAHSTTPRVDRREARQHVRIHQGARTGTLTRGEAMRLRAGQRHVHRMERRAKADGRVTVRERARMTHAQNHQNRAIYRLKHNGRVR